MIQDVASAIFLLQDEIRSRQFPESPVWKMAGTQYTKAWT